MIASLLLGNMLLCNDLTYILIAGLMAHCSASPEVCSFCAWTGDHMYKNTPGAL